jgi:hypothetical protein
VEREVLERRPVLRDEPELERELRDELPDAFDGVSAARSLSKSLSA